MNKIGPTVSCRQTDNSAALLGDTTHGGWATKWGINTSQKRRPQLTAAGTELVVSSSPQTTTYAAKS